ncbi:helix-turn-helix transcriptional regulator [Pedobacter nutrimenti]|uniref:response regulator transcription factor n=1 Tax=Pedobacter nutrimenti TaxID=1241337 RepID=UPI00292DDE5E|nr:helix-turn-helix transcriptional regulator [Pedobacter nutrimenti]
MAIKSLSQLEMQQHCQAQILSLGNNIASKILKIEDIGDYIPGSVMVQDLSSLTNTYMNQTGCDYLKHSKEELQAMGPEYFSRFFPAEEITLIKNDLFQFVNEGDANKVYSFFQRVRPDANNDYKWYFTTSRLYPSNEPGNALKMIHIAFSVNNMSYAGRKLSNLVEDDAFIRKNLHRFNLLSRREKEIIRLIVEGKSSFEIASCLYLSIHTVNNHRKNIIHKLETNSLSQLIKFAVSFGII